MYIFKINRRVMCCIIAFIIFVMTVGINVNASESNIGENFELETYNTEIQVCFEDQSSSTQEMYDKSELVITGNVVSQETEIRLDMVFTMSTVEIIRTYKGEIEDETITILQTGGVKGDVSTSVKDGTLLEVDDYKLFYLRKADDRSCLRYGTYYLVVGGTQGIADTSCIQNETSVYNSLEIINSEVMPVYENPRPGQRFYKSQGIKVYILDNTGNFNAFWGFAMWPQFVGSEYISFVEVPASSTRDILCVINDYGDTGWNGRTEWGYSGTSSLITYASIAINTSSIESYMGNQWSDRACATIGHEVGHALGLLHPEDEGSITTVPLDPTQRPVIASIMAKYNCTYCIEDPSIYDGVVYSTPQEYDIQCIRNIYEE